jgi:hypothetical protein
MIGSWFFLDVIAGDNDVAKIRRSVAAYHMAITKALHSHYYSRIIATAASNAAALKKDQPGPM